jgi:hypothetical protein
MEGALAPVERSFRTVKSDTQKAGGCAHSVPKHLGDRGLGLPSPHPITQEQSHYPPPCLTPRQSPSNVWGVGYRLLAEYEEVARTA